MADPGVPLHPAARAGHPAQPAARRARGPTLGAVLGLVVGLRPGRWARSLGAGPGWWYRSGATPASRPAWPPCVTGCRWCSVNTDAVPGRGQPAARALRRGQRGGLRGHRLPRAHVTGTPVRPEIAALDRSPEGRAAARGHARPAAGPPDGGRVRRLARGLPHQPGRGRAGRTLGGRGGPLALPRRRAGGTTSSSRRGRRTPTGRRRPTGLRYRVVPFEDRMPDRLRRRRRRACAGPGP